MVFPPIFPSHFLPASQTHRENRPILPEPQPKTDRKLKEEVGELTSPAPSQLLTENFMELELLLALLLSYTSMISNRSIAD